MVRKFFLFFLLSGVFSILHGQNAPIIMGKVYDSETKLPIADASVYLNGTSFSTKTNESGVFYLKVAKRMNTQLIINHISYEILEINNPFEKEPIEAYLTAKDYSLNEVVIKSGRFSREQLYKAFEQQFLGDDKAGRSCTILNKEDIQLRYDEDEKTLSATNEQPVIVENNYLGYRLHCLLTDFRVRYSDKSLNARSMNLYY